MENEKVINLTIIIKKKQSAFSLFVCIYMCLYIYIYIHTPLYFHVMGSLGRARGFLCEANRRESDGMSLNKYCF